MAEHGPALQEMNDLRYALRTLRNSPGFTLVVTILLALGIGASCAIFSALDAVMLKRLPVRHPEQLYWIFTNRPQLGKRSYMKPDGFDRVDCTLVSLRFFRTRGSPGALGVLVGFRAPVMHQFLWFRRRTATPEPLNRLRNS